MTKGFQVKSPHSILKWLDSRSMIPEPNHISSHNSIKNIKTMYMIFCFDNASLTDVESIQVPRSKTGGGGPKSGGAILKSSSLGLTEKTQGPFQ